MKNLQLKILENGYGLPIPKYESEGAAGLDLLAAISESKNIIILPGKAEMVPTGIAIALPKGFEAQIRPRSGLAAKNGITILNSPGTIDSDYRGEISAMLINHSKVNFEIERGMRIAQMVIAPVVQFNLIKTETLDETKRGAGGFGSTGISAKDECK
ncbi:dUTP diphosphatase [Hyphomicrobiales bacterium]|jgi:dUTP pyrophosphatase|nr:dUTP diphosphatase [Alphaproteobacteria bacterium]MBT5662365.1 dUTP diphosphatase [Alphaproteobacteria bacterium]MDC0475224.1 dUTP diphosphatase [Hyphomicrobiales bacterium]MDG1523961.1 dUTP diphosphatase [Hyphomicrobiales bacterium]|tara:strand:- start:77 stop:547 length:471 start_codon:yes stop_codon:yes gene_type:complete